MPPAKWRLFGFFYAATILLLLNSVNAAPYLKILSPTNGTLLNNGNIYLGKVAPGESFYILASPTTPNYNGTLINIGWDRLTYVTLPTGWSAQPSLLYENPMEMKITVLPTAQSGIYSMVLRAVNIGNYSKLGNLTFTAYVNVTPTVFNISVGPKKIYAGLNKPVNVHVTINNTGVSDGQFAITASGLPAWNSTENIIVLHSRQNNYIYPVFVSEPGTYKFNVSVGSTTSPLVGKTFEVTLIANASLENDYVALGQGVNLAPIVFEPAYAVLQFINDIYKYLAG